MKFEKIKLKEVLNQYRNNFFIDDSEIYRQVRISQTGKVSFRGEKLGAEIGRKRQFYVNLKEHPNTLIFIRQGVMNGGIGICPQEVDGCIVTENMPMFEIVNIESEYLINYIHSSLFKKDISRLVPTGTAQKAIHERQLLELEIPLPSIENQKYAVKKINSIKNEISELENKNKKDLTLIKKLRQSILSDAVSGKLVSQDPNDESVKILLERIKKEKEKLISEKKIKKEKPLPKIEEHEIPYELPKGWAWCRLGKVVGYGQCPKINAENISDNEWVLDLEDIEKITSRLISKKRFNEKESKSTKNKFSKGDVLYGKLRPYLDKTIIADEDGYCTTEILPIKIYKNLIENKYLKLFLKNPNFIKYVNDITYGIKMPRLGTEDARKTLFPLPSLSEQKRIIAKVDKLMKLCNLLEKKVKENEKDIEKLMDSVLREVFSD